MFKRIVPVLLFLAALPCRVLAAEVGDEVRSGWEAFRCWYEQAAVKLWSFIAVTLAVVVVVTTCEVLLRRRKAHLEKHGKLKFHRELFFVVAEPLLITVGILGIFSYAVPLAQSIPALYIFDLRFFTTLAALAVTWGLVKVVGTVSDHMYTYAQSDDNKLDALFVEIMSKLLDIAIVAIMVYFILQCVFGLHITTLLAGAGVAGLAIAFASKETLANFFGTLVIILDKPFRCGDRVQINGVDGIVGSVGMRSTRILTFDESVYTIPNSAVADSSVENISNSGVIRHAFTVGVVYSTPRAKIQEAIAILHRILDDFRGKDSPEYRPRIFFDELGESSLKIKVIVWLKTSSFEQEEEWRTQINLEIVERFAASGITIAYNTVTNSLTNDSGLPLNINIVEHR